MAARPGMSLVEVMVAVAIGGAVALGATALATREVEGRATNQEVLANQQAMALTLQRFSQDVRAGSGLARATDTDFRIRKALPDGTFRYVSYRLAGGKLQRGEGAGRGADPATWEDVFDASRFTVSAGKFTYFTLGNGNGTQQALMRRIAIAGFQLRTTRTNAVVKTPPISAVMREASNARDLASGCEPEVRGHDGGANAWGTGTVHVTVCATNRSDQPVTLDAFAADWASGAAPNPIEAVKLESGGVLWGEGQAEYLKNGPARTFDTPVTIPAGATQRFVLQVHSVSGKTDALALKFYAPADTTRANPYFLATKLP